VYSLWIDFFNRGLRGYTLSDVHDMDSYLSKVILKMLKEFKTLENSYPYNMTEVDWAIILDEMIDGFEAYRKNLSYPEDSTPELYEDRRRKFNKGMALFSAYFGNLYI
jgi:hypothetical protein